MAQAGEGGRPLLLLHGFTGAKEDFTEHEGWVDRLASRGWHVVAPDQRGHGDSDQPGDEAAYSFEQYAVDALALVDALGWSGFALLGHSMGGMIAQHVALAAPDRVRALVLMDTSHGPLEGISEEETEAMAGIAREKGMAYLHELMNERGGVLDSPASLRLRETRPGWTDFERRKFVNSAPAMCGAMIAAFRTTQDRLDDLAAIEAPTLVIVGEQDKPFLAPSERMAKTIPNAKLAVIPDAGHSPQFEGPDAWGAALTDFLDSIDDAPGRA